MPLALSNSIASRLLPLRLPRVCLALASETADELLNTAEAMARDNPFLEFRLDYLKQPASALPKIRRFLDTHQYVTSIGTCRRAENGGHFKGSMVAQIEILSKAAAAGRQLLDLEVESGSRCKPEAVARLRSHAGL